MKNEGWADIPPARFPDRSLEDIRRDALLVYMIILLTLDNCMTWFPESCKVNDITVGQSPKPVYLGSYDMGLLREH